MSWAQHLDRSKGVLGQEAAALIAVSMAACLLACWWCRKLAHHCKKHPSHTVWGCACDFIAGGSHCLYVLRT